MTVTITKPDGTKETQGPFTSDPLGDQYFMYKPDIVGKYYFQMSFPGQILALKALIGDLLMSVIILSRAPVPKQN